MKQVTEEARCEKGAEILVTHYEEDSFLVRIAQTVDSNPARQIAESIRAQVSKV